MKKIDFVDSLRGLSILAVIMVHTYQFGRTEMPNVIARIIGAGSHGMQLFFLVSSFTLFLSLKMRSPKEMFPIRNFFIRRVFRIAPMYYVGIFYYLFQDRFGSWDGVGSSIKITAAHVLSNLGFIHSFSPYWVNRLVPGGWSIGIEMTFYLLLPLLFLRIKNINQAFNFFLLSLIFRAVLAAVFLKFPLIPNTILWEEFLYFYLPGQLPIFGLGILLYFIICENQSLVNISGKSLLGFFFIVLSQLALASNFIFQKHIVFGMALVVLFISLNKYKFKLIVNPVIGYIGKISFSIYLVHFAVFFWLIRLRVFDYFSNKYLNICTRYLIVTLITVAIASVFYSYVEVPFQKLGKMIIEKWETKSKAKMELT